jgi:hypothetical protein
MRLNLEPLEARENPAAITNPVAFQAAVADLGAVVNQVLTSPTPPSAASVNNLILTTYTALSDQIVSPTEQIQIFQAAGQVLSEANVPVSQLVRIVVDIQVIRASIT